MELIHSAINNWFWEEFTLKLTRQGAILDSVLSKILVASAALKEVAVLRHNDGYIIKFDIFTGDHIRYYWLDEL